MRRIVLARPDVSISLPIAAMALVGSIGGAGACLWFLASPGSTCQILPVLSVSVALLAPLPWALRRRIPAGKRATLVFVAFALLAAAAAMPCR